MTRDDIIRMAREAMQTNAYAVANEAPHRDVMAYYEAIAALAEALTEDALQRLTDANQEIEAALKQPEQEPVAWLDEEINCAYTPQELDGGSADGLLPLFTHPPRREWRGLTEEEVEDLYFDEFSMGEMQAFARAIEAALKERNA